MDDMDDKGNLANNIVFAKEEEPTTDNQLRITGILKVKLDMFIERNPGQDPNLVKGNGVKKMEIENFNDNNQKKIHLYFNKVEK